MEEEAVVREVDEQGRISIPKRWRDEMKSNKFIAVKSKGKIELRPIEGVPPSRLFDSIEIAGSLDFTDSRALKKAALQGRVG